MRTNKTRLRIVTLSILIFSLIWGCSRRDKGRPETAPVHGVVTYRGQPVAKASVTFFNDKSPRSASGETDDSGRYSLTTFVPGDGAVIGEHAVTVYKPKVENPAMGIDPNLDPKAYMAALDKASAQAIKAQEAGSALPRRYADQKSTDIHENVQRGENVIDIKLVD